MSIQDPELLAAFRGVKPIRKSNRFDTAAQKKKKQPYFDKSTDRESFQDGYFSDQWQAEQVDFEQELKFSRDGVDYRTMLALKKGQLQPEDHLDLHGMTIEQARDEVSHFIHYASLHQLRCIRIVHGKGYKAKQAYPILKNKVNSWLQQHPHVLAFHSALPRDGGNGAVYILLKQLKS